MEIKVRGRLGNDPELKSSSNGTDYCTFSLAYTPRKKVNNEWVDGETQWYRVVAFDKKAQQAATLRKGEAVLLFGSVKLSTYTGKDGAEKSSLEITASEIYTEIKRDTTPQYTAKTSNDAWGGDTW